MTNYMLDHTGQCINLDGSISSSSPAANNSSVRNNQNLFSPSERTVSRVRAPGLEFNQRDYLVTWQDENQNLRVARVDPITGDLRLARGEILDTKLAPRNPSDPAGTANGPEWVDSAAGRQIVYTKLINNNWFLGRARLADGRADIGVLPQGQNGFAPIASFDADDPAPRIVYGVGSPGIDRSDIALEWRELNDPSIGGLVTESPGGPARWVPGERSLVLTQEINGIFQAFKFEIDSNQFTQLTFDALPKGDLFMWRAPEFNNNLVFLVLEGPSPNTVGFTTVGIYRNVGSNWIKIKTIELPSAKQFVSSPQPFVYNGRSYISMTAADEPFPPIVDGLVPTEVWITDIEPTSDFYRQVNDSSDPLSRYATEPEAFILETGAFIYYYIQDAGIVRIADTGLGPPNDGN